MRNVAAVLILVFASSLAGEAQSIGAMTLLKISPSTQDAEIDRSRCGDYFFLIENPGLTPPGARVEMVTKWTIGNVAVAILRDKFKTIIDTSPTPTAEVILREGTGLALLNQNGKIPAISLRPQDIESVIVRLNQEDYLTASRCLPPPAP